MRASFVAIALAVSTVLGVHAGPASAESLPVPHDVTAGLRAEAANPGGTLPESNDWSCRPTAEHPRPVVLVHATFLNRQANWSTYVPLLKNEGYCVFALTYGTLPGAWPLNAIGGIGSMKDSARQLGGFVDEVLAATGAEKIDLVAHSQGTLMPNHYVRFLGGAAKVDRYVSLAPLWRGGGRAPAADDPTVGAPYDLDPMQRDVIGRACAACLEMEPGSDFIREMNADGGPYAPGVTYTNIMTRYDDVVVPYTSGFVPGPNATNIVVQDRCPQDMSHHMGMAGSPVAAGHVLNALDPAHPRPVPCMPVSPNTGAPLG
ncbi:lipase family alpha/beta hydrolase [Rhodococcus sp. NPDC003322]